MFKKWFKKEEAPRVVNGPEDLMQGDIVIFKYRQAMPSIMSGNTFEVKEVATYQYSGEVTKEVTLHGDGSSVIHMSIEHNDGNPRLSFSLKLPQAAVLSIFDEDEFAGLWAEDFCTLTVKNKHPDFSEWLADTYRQSVKFAEAYYYRKDCSKDELSQYADDDSEELRYHECEGDPEGFGISVEIWEDGSTDVALTYRDRDGVIEDIFPAAQTNS